MLSDDILNSLNWQVNRELYSAYFYMGMATYASSIGWKGIANWFNIQAKEELDHAEKIYIYVNGQGRRVKLKEIEQPPQEFSSATDLFNKTLGHEKKVTKMIGDLVALARQEGDKETENFLQWFVKEQLEEEANASGVLKKISSAGYDKDAIAMVDSQLLKRK